MVFSTRDEFKKAVDSHAIKTKRTLRFTKTDPKRVCVACDATDCRFQIHLNKVVGQESWQIRKYYWKHSCGTTNKVKNLNSRWLSERYLSKFVSDPKRRLKGFRKDVIDEFGCNISKHQTHRAKRLALKKLEGSPDEQCNKLWDYSEELRRSCRPIIGVDGCHLKGPHKGILLTAIGVDPNNNLYPIAYAVVATESKDTWEWFLHILRVDLEITKHEEFTFMSDKQKGLIQAFNEVFPTAHHRFCVRHLHCNFKTAGFIGLTFKTALWRAAQATTVEGFKQMLEMKELNERAWEWLNARPAEQWSKSHFNEIPKCDMLLNNACEAFNSIILEARELPILSMMEWIREWLMERLQTHKDTTALKWKDMICPRIKKILEKHAEKVSDCILIKSDRTHYQISCRDGSQYCVDLEEMNCTCRSWGLSGMPCKHALSAIFNEDGKGEDFVHESYTVETYHKVYASAIRGINGQALWEFPTETQNESENVQSKTQINSTSERQKLQVRKKQAASHTRNVRRKQSVENSTTEQLGETSVGGDARGNFRTPRQASK